MRQSVAVGLAAFLLPSAVLGRAVEPVLARVEQERAPFIVTLRNSCPSNPCSGGGKSTCSPKSQDVDTPSSTNRRQIGQEDLAATARLFVAVDLQLDGRRVSGR